MLAVKHYDVRISNKDQIISQKLYNTTNFLFDYSDYHLNFTLIINIAVIDIKGQRSNSTVISKTIGIQTKISSKCMLHTYVRTYLISYIHTYTSVTTRVETKSQTSDPAIH